MQTKNVFYSEKPDKVIVTANGKTALVEFPVDVKKITTGEGEEARIEYVAETVYAIKTTNTSNLKERVSKHYDAWLEVAKHIEPQHPSLSDVIEAVNTLTDIIVGGE